VRSFQLADRERDLAQLRAANDTLQADKVWLSEGICVLDKRQTVAREITCNIRTRNH